MYAAVLPGFPNLKEELDTPCLESVTLAREVLMTADKWGIDELYQHLLEEFKRDLTHSNCTETLVWSMTKGTAQTSKIALAFFVQHRHEVKKHSADTLELLNILDEEQMREVLVAVL
jgi:pyocin large subunit-like protein